MTFMEIDDTGDGELVIRDMAGNVIAEKDLRPPVEPIRIYVYPPDPEGVQVIPKPDSQTKVTILAGKKTGVFGIHATAKFRQGFPGIEIAREDVTVTAPKAIPASGQIVITNIRPQ